MNKLTLLVCTITILSTLIYSCIPQIQVLKSRIDRTSSLNSLKNAGQGLALYNAEHGHNPCPTQWVASLTELGIEDIQDPVYKSLTKINQPLNPGWGMNTRPFHPIGKTTGLNNKNFNNTKIPIPPDSIVLAPSYASSFTPWHNGEIPEQPLSKTNPLLTKHNTRLGNLSYLGREGLYGLYLFQNGDIRMLAPNESQKYLALNDKTVDYTEKTPSPTLTKTNDIWPESTVVDDVGFRLTQSTKSSLLAIASTKFNSITISYQSDRPITFTTKVSFFNQYKQVINSDQSQNYILTSVYPGWGPLKTNKPIPNGQIVGVNPDAFHITNLFVLKHNKPYSIDGTMSKNKLLAHYVKSTPISSYKDHSITLNTSLSSSAWYNKALVKKTDVPSGCEFVKIQIILPKDSSLLVRGPFFDNKPN